MTFITALTQDGKGRRGSDVPGGNRGITSSFVSTVAVVDFPQWKNSEAKGHIGWFFLGIKEGCK